MFSAEPVVRVGILEGQKEVRGFFHGPFKVQGQTVMDIPFFASFQGKTLHLTAEGKVLGRGDEVVCLPQGEKASFSLYGVTIGRQFHWEREEKQTFQGSLLFRSKGEGITVINALPLEQYLESVIPSEMSDRAPEEFLKAHAVVARSWIGRRLLETPHPFPSSPQMKEGEIIRWYGQETHADFHVCSDDHCQRYQGLTRRMTGKASQAARETRGLFLTFDGEICDARYHKSCGGRTELFKNAWEEREVPYLRSVSCAYSSFPYADGEEEARRWILSHPDAFCGEADDKVLEVILNDFDLDTHDFFRWEVSYSCTDLSDIVKEKGGTDLGHLTSLTPLARGPSGRIVLMKLVGEKGSVVVGKELEIRRWLSPNHLLSSAFILEPLTDCRGRILSFHFRGAGWGHGVGMCQIGAAVMALRGASFREILLHYFPGTVLSGLY